METKKCGTNLTAHAEAKIHLGRIQICLFLPPGTRKGRLVDFLPLPVHRLVLVFLQIMKVASKILGLRLRSHAWLLHNHFLIFRSHQLLLNQILYRTDKLPDRRPPLRMILCRRGLPHSLLLRPEKYHRTYPARGTEHSAHNIHEMTILSTAGWHKMSSGKSLSLKAMELPANRRRKPAAGSPILLNTSSSRSRRSLQHNKLYRQLH